MEIVKKDWHKSMSLADYTVKKYQSKISLDKNPNEPVEHYDRSFANPNPNSLTNFSMANKVK